MADEANGNGDGPKVSYTVKELLIHIDGKIDALGVIVGSKADTTEVRALADRVLDLETTRNNRGAVLTDRQRLIGSIVVLLTLVGVFFGPLISHVLA